jgi:carbon monoxide dehydrogenase subunit G
MDVSGERRLPAARQVVWNALSDPATLAESLPAGVSMDRVSDGSFDLAAVDGSWRTRATPDAGNGPAQSILHLAAPLGADRGVAGRADLTMAEDGVFTRLMWRVTADLPDEFAPRVIEAVEHVLSHVGQRSATPEPVAAQGLAGAAAAAVNAMPSAATAETATRAIVGQGPLDVVRRTVAAAPRDQLIGGALFAVVLLFVVGAL